eukprot:scaffold39161_cov44-Attheya_sp.AAC.1
MLAWSDEVRVVMRSWMRMEEAKGKENVGQHGGRFEFFLIPSSIEKNSAPLPLDEPCKGQQEKIVMLTNHGTREKCHMMQHAIHSSIVTCRLVPTIDDLLHQIKKEIGQQGFSGINDLKPNSTAQVVIFVVISVTIGTMILKGGVVYLEHNVTKDRPPDAHKDGHELANENQSPCRSHHVTGMFQRTVTNLKLPPPYQMNRFIPSQEAYQRPPIKGMRRTKDPHGFQHIRGRLHILQQRFHRRRHLDYLFVATLATTCRSSSSRNVPVGY